MKRGSDSLGALISMCPASDYDSMYDGGMDEEGEHGHGHGGHIPEKKRRLSLEQVKSLEKYFEVENKLEPERKVKLAQELGLQPRQVAVWFQNRRARWKTKQLERDYGLLKSNFDTLKLNYDSLLQGNDTLLNQIKALKAKLGEKAVESNKGGGKGSEPVTPPPPCIDEKREGAELKDGPTESDSSAIFNEDNNNNNDNSNSPNGSEKMVGFNSFSCFTESRLSEDVDVVYQPQFVKLEEHNFMSGEEACNFFSDEAAPTLHWYCPDQWISGETV